MANYMYVYYKDAGGEAPSEEGMAVVKAWFGALGESLVDFGGPFNDNGMAVEKSGTSAIENYPSSGYSIVKADSMDAAVALLDGCPMLEGPGAAVRVYEVMAM